jgi:hypothetical protein
MFQVSYDFHGRPQVSVTLDQYEIMNLMGLMDRTKQHDNGDWFEQLRYKLRVAARFFKNESQMNNFGDEIKFGSE